MIFIAGIDGGATKTRMVIADETGKVLADVCDGPSNHQMIGADGTRTVLERVYANALKASGLTPQDLSLVYLGLAGADMACDFELLGGICHDVFGDVPFELVNDTWIIQRSGTPDKWGAVVICGTGANAAAVTPKGEKLILRSLGYVLGGASGGYEIAMSALHWAFRSEEGTSTKSLLEERLPEVLGVEGMHGLLERLYPINTLTTDEMALVTPVVFELANAGDVVSQDILIHAGKELGEMLAGLLKQLDMSDAEIPVVFGGSVLHGSNPLLTDQLMLSVHRVAPKAYAVHPRIVPVGGALLLGWEKLDIATEPHLHEVLKHSLGI